MLGGCPCIPLHLHKSWFANLQTLFFELIRVSLSFEHLVFYFLFLEWHLYLFYTTFSCEAIRILCASERKERKRKKHSQRKYVGKGEANSYKYVMAAKNNHLYPYLKSDISQVIDEKSLSTFH
jgi:hypothetical protein